MEYSLSYLYRLKKPSSNMYDLSTSKSIRQVFRNLQQEHYFSRDISMTPLVNTEKNKENIFYYVIFLFFGVLFLFLTGLIHLHSIRPECYHFFDRALFYSRFPLLRKEDRSR